MRLPFSLKYLTCVHDGLLYNLYSPIYMVAEIRKTEATTTTERKKRRNLIIAPMTSIP